MRRYLSWLAVRNYSPVTIEQRRLYLRLFVSWADTRGLRRPDEVTKPAGRHSADETAAASFPWPLVLVSAAVLA